jgi:hypothetical protein
MDSAASFDRRAEVKALLDADDTALGDIWRQMQKNLSVEQIAHERGVQAGVIYAFQRTIRVLLDGEVPEKPFVAAGNASRIRSWLKKKTMSEDLRAQLMDQERAIAANVDNTNAAEEELADSIKATQDAEAQGVPGIYVYTLPHYLKYPVDRDTGKTLLKVGHSSTDAVYRANSQGRLTALPEDPVLLRIYPTGASSGIEKQFHEWLRKADHYGARSRRAGSEWFLTSTKFLDHIAATLDLEVREVNPLEVGDE